MRLIATVLSVVLGAVLGALIGAFGLFYLCEFIDWMRDAGPANKIGGGAWILLIFTVPGGAFILGALFGTFTWMSQAPCKTEEASSLHKGRQREFEQSEDSDDGIFIDDEDYGPAYDD